MPWVRPSMALPKSSGKGALSPSPGLLVMSEITGYPRGEVNLAPVISDIKALRATSAYDLPLTPTTRNIICEDPLWSEKASPAGGGS